MPLPLIDPETFKRAMRRHAAAVTVVTTEFQGQWRGLTATAVCSVSAAPPTLLACVQRNAAAHSLIAASRRFCVNVLASEQAEISHRFAGGESGPARFRDGEWEALATGAPALKGALSSFDCELAQAIEVATHTVLIGCVVAVRTQPERTPLLYSDGGYRAIVALDAQLRPASAPAGLAPPDDKNLNGL